MYTNYLGILFNKKIYSTSFKSHASELSIKCGLLYMYINLCSLLKTQKITADEEKCLNLRDQKKQKNK